jgi:hypothetical protein
MATDYDVSLGSAIPKVDEGTSLPPEGYCSNLSCGQSMCGRALSFERVVCTEYMSEFLVWPDTPKCRGKRMVERKPFEITSEKYQEMFEKKHLAKVAEEKE